MDNQFRIYYLMFILVVVASAVSCTGTMACDQTWQLPPPGTTAQAIENRFGEPTTILTQLDELELHLRALDNCSEAAAKNVSSIWRYEKDRMNNLLIAMDGNRRVVCAGHAGHTFIE
jgi:hypothetical protein